MVKKRRHVFALLLGAAGIAATAAERPAMHVSADVVESVIVTYAWTGLPSTPPESELFIIKRLNGRWTRRVFLRDGQDVTLREALGENDAQGLERITRLAASLEKRAPAMGLYM